MNLTYATCDTGTYAFEAPAEFAATHVSFTNATMYREAGARCGVYFNLQHAGWNFSSIVVQFIVKKLGAAYMGTSIHASA